MSNSQSLRPLSARGSAEAAPGATTTFVRADPWPLGDNMPMHPQLCPQLRELQLRTGSATPDLAMLLRLINDHYHATETERRGIVESMRLMADEARALANEAHKQSSDRLQVILDHIKDDLKAIGALLVGLVGERARLIRHEAHRLDDAASLGLGRVVMIVDEPQQHREIRRRAAGAQLQLAQLRAQLRVHRHVVPEGPRIRPDEGRGGSRGRLGGAAGAERPQGLRI